MLLYSNELVPPRARPPLLLFKPPPPAQLKDKYKALLARSFAYSTVHGMHSVFDAGQRLWQRYFWLLIVLCAAGGCCVMYPMLAERHNEQHLITIVETTQLPLYNIEFPAIAVCPSSQVNWLRANLAFKRLLPAQADARDYETFQQLLVALDKLTYGRFERLGGTLAQRNLSALAELSLMELTSYLSYRCDEVFVVDSCVFDDTSYDCCKLFITERTEQGQCMVFNSLISEDSRKQKLVNPYYPHKLSKPGEGSGLRFSLRHNYSVDAKMPFTMNLLVKEPRQWTQTIMYHLYENTENFVAIIPSVMETSSNTNHLKPARRRCYFTNETNPNFPLSDLPYNRGNCIAVCLQRAVRRICKCTLSLFLPSFTSPGRSRECNVLDFQCLYRNNDIFSYVRAPDQDKYMNETRRGQFCSCLDNCKSRIYQLTLNVRKLSAKPNGTQLITADIYYGQRVLTKYETKLEYTYLDLVANYGGVLGLFLGASVLSLAELSYVATKLLWALLKDARLRLKKDTS